MDHSYSDSEMNKAETTPKTSFGSFKTGRKRVREDILTEEFAKFKEDLLKQMTSNFLAHEQELKKIAPTLKKIEQTNVNIENAVSFLSAQNEELKSKITSLEKQVKEDKKYITVLEDKLEDLQMGSRKTNIEIKNVPKKNDETKEDLVEMVICLSKSVNAPLNKTDIRDIYRVRGKREDIKNTPIIVETSSTLVKTDVLKLCKAFNIRHKEKLCAKHLGLRAQEDTPIFVSENLTPKQSRLHFLARNLVKNKKYKYCWTAYGKVYVRRDENSKIELVKNEGQVQELLNNA